MRGPPTTPLILTAMAAACELVEGTGAEVVAVAFLIELTALAGRDKLPGRKITTVISY